MPYQKYQRPPIVVRFDGPTTHSVDIVTAVSLIFPWLFIYCRSDDLGTRKSF